ncbi:MAG: site-2 protease family protein [Hyphomicrobiaceae bacterium]|nr:MAG: site-2 protease family protein [Hyphomicrobiaceae bacterium]
MSWSIGLGRILGVDVRIHLTFFLLLAWYGIAAGAQGGMPEAAAAIVFILAVFACVLAHEYGHVLTARAYGIGTRDIVLLPIGGVASIERMPEKPREELIIALAGPAVNVVIAAALFPFVASRLEGLSAAADIRLDFLTRLFLVNVMLVLFNLIPAFPMDGGRVLRALLAMVWDRRGATRLAARIGQIVAFGLGFLGLFGNPMLLFIALFVFLAASHESYAVELSEATKSAAMSEAQITSFTTLPTGSTVGDAVKALLSSAQQEFPVTDGAGRLRGVLTREGMIRALASTGPDTPVLDVMTRDIPVLDRRAPLSEAVAALQSTGQPLVGIIDEDSRVVGIITRENIAEYMMVNEARRGWRGSSAQPAPAGRTL